MKIYESLLYIQTGTSPFHCSKICKVICKGTHISIFSLVRIENISLSLSKITPSTQALDLMPSLLCIFSSLSPSPSISFLWIIYSSQQTKELCHLIPLEQQQIFLDPLCPFSCHFISSLLLQQNFFKGLTLYSSSSSSTIIQPQHGFHLSMVFTSACISPQHGFHILAFTATISVEVANYTSSFPIS